MYMGFPQRGNNPWHSLTMADGRAPFCPIRRLPVTRWPFYKRFLLLQEVF